MSRTLKWFLLGIVIFFVLNIGGIIVGAIILHNSKKTNEMSSNISKNSSEITQSLRQPENPTGDPQVARAQNLLAELGYDPGPVDGVHGEFLIKRLRVFD